MINTHMSLTSASMRVAVDGTVTYGVHVPHRKRDGERVLASPARVAKTTRFAGGSMIPAGVDQKITLPHDCANHLPEDD